MGIPHPSAEVKAGLEKGREYDFSLQRQENITISSNFPTFSTVDYQMPRRSGGAEVDNGHIQLFKYLKTAEQKFDRCCRYWYNW